MSEAYKFINSHIKCKFCSKGIGSLVLEDKELYCEECYEKLIKPSSETLKEENKRLRSALERIAASNPGYDDNFEEIEIAREALRNDPPDSQSVEV